MRNLDLSAVSTSGAVHFHECRCGYVWTCPMPLAEADRSCRIRDPYVCELCRLDEVRALPAPVPVQRPLEL